MKNWMIWQLEQRDTKPHDQTNDPFLQIHSVTENCDQKLDRIVEIICNKNDCLDNEMNSIQSILSPRQIAKFIIWIDQNPVCMQMLEALWPHMTVNLPVVTGVEEEHDGTNGKKGGDGISNGGNGSSGKPLSSYIPLIKSESVDIDMDDDDSSYSEDS